MPRHASLTGRRGNPLGPPLSIAATPVGAAAHSVDGDTAETATPATDPPSCYTAVHNVDSSLCHIRGTDWYARFGR